MLEHCCPSNLGKWQHINQQEFSLSVTHWKRLRDVFAKIIPDLQLSCFMMNWDRRWRCVNCVIQRKYALIVKTNIKIGGSDFHSKAAKNTPWKAILEHCEGLIYHCSTDFTVIGDYAAEMYTAVTWECALNHCQQYTSVHYFYLLFNCLKHSLFSLNL